MTYQQMLELSKAQLKVKLIKAIDNETLKISYSFHTNLHCDYGIQNQWFGSAYTYKKSEANKRIQQFQKVKGKKFKLTSTDNSLGFTRLIYELV